MATWVITLHGVDADGVKHSVVHRLPAEVVNVSPADVAEAERRGLVPGPWIGEQKSHAMLRAWHDSARESGFYSKDGKHCSFAAIDSAVEPDPS